MDDRIKWEQLAAGSWRGRCGPACYAIFETSHRPPKIRIEHDGRSLDGYCLGPVDGDVESAKRVCEIHNSANAAEYARANGYVKLADDEIVVKRLEDGEACFSAANVDKMAKHFGYVKLEPGQVVVDEASINKALDLYDREIEKLGDAIDPTDADDYSIEDYMSQLIEERYRLRSAIGCEVEP